MVVRPVLCRTFVGRREELAYLHERRLEAGMSRGGLVFVAGDAGLGKSRLISEFCGRLAYSRWRVAQGACTEFGGRPYGPLLDVLARLDGSPVQLVPAASKQEQIDAFAARIVALSARNALIVVIEDLHWADAATLDLLVHLGSSLHRMRVLILASFRPDALFAGHPAAPAIAKIERNARAGRIDLAPLRGVELRTFIDEALGDTPLPDEPRRAIARAGEGNPFFTEELLKSAVERQSAPLPSPGSALPETVRATLVDRLGPLEPEERRVITHAAAIGRTFDLRLLATTLGMQPPALLPTLRRARDFQLIEELAPMLFRFRHGLTREAIYGDFLRSERQPLHRTIALALEQDQAGAQAVEDLAFQWWAAGDDARSTHFNTLAGDAAARLNAHEDASSFYERALESGRIDPATRGAIIQKLAEMRFAMTLTEEAHAKYGEAADAFCAAAEFDREAACRVHAGIIAYTGGLPEPAAGLEAMLLRLDPGEYLARSRAHLGIAWVKSVLGLPTQAALHLEQVDQRALSEAAEIRWRYHSVAASNAMARGDVERLQLEQAALVETAVAGGSARRIATAHANGATFFTYFGMRAEAFDSMRRAVKAARDAHNPYVTESVSAFSAFPYLVYGDLEHARELVEAVPTTTENRINLMIASAWGTLIGAHLDDASMMAKWFDVMQHGDAPELDMECGAGLAEVLVRRGRLEDAADLLHRVLLPDIESVRGSFLTFLATGRYGRPKDRARARELLLRASATPVRTPELATLALFDALESERNAQHERAEKLAREAAEGFRTLQFPLLEAAALEAARDIEGAVPLYRRCGASYDVRRLSGPQVQTSPANDVISTLSEREREIASLAAKGQSNLDIARTLSISHKTVEKHLASAFRKLGIASRRQLRDM